jgi:hypothetical protein
MLYASRGARKTHVALGIAYAVATGSAFLKWWAPRARRVLPVDGEMSRIGRICVTLGANTGRSISGG